MLPRCTAPRARSQPASRIAACGQLRNGSVARKLIEFFLRHAPERNHRVGSRDLCRNRPVGRRWPQRAARPQRAVRRIDFGAPEVQHPLFEGSLGCQVAPASLVPDQIIDLKAELGVEGIEHRKRQRISGKSRSLPAIVARASSSAGLRTRSSSRLKWLDVSAILMAGTSWSMWRSQPRRLLFPNLNCRSSMSCS
jgi:hypothetical protein